MDSSSHASRPVVPVRLKTCQTCIRAKIRCDRTQDSGSCDRCLRLGKECVFAPARRMPSARRQQQRAHYPHSPSGSVHQEAERGETERREPAVSSLPATTSSASSISCLDLAVALQDLDPLTQGLVSTHEAERILDVYRRRMTPHFPFVPLPASLSLQQMRQERPCLLLAVLMAGSPSNPNVQERLGRSFNRLVAAQLARDEVFASLDMLQGLLVHIAWAHFQPRPQRYSQHLQLAVSIVCDSRYDRPKNPRLWNVERLDKSPPAATGEWGLEEMRAASGAYYLASSSSIILQKMKHYPYSDFLLQSCKMVAAVGEYPTDMFLPHIISVQHMAERVDDIVVNTPSHTPLAEIHAAISHVQRDLEQLKASLTFPLSRCPTIALQLYSLELVQSQLLLPGFPFGVTTSDGPQDQQQPHQQCQQQDRSMADPELVIGRIAACMAAAKSLVDFFISMTIGEEFVLPNMAWIMLSFGMSLAVRLDVLARDPRIASRAQPLLRFLDVPDALHQIFLRIKGAAAMENDLRISDLPLSVHASSSASVSSVSPASSSSVYPHDSPHSEQQAAANTQHRPFTLFLRRARAIDAWYLGQRGIRSKPASDAHNSSSNSTATTTSTTAMTTAASVTPEAILDPTPSFLIESPIDRVHEPPQEAPMFDPFDFSVMEFLTSDNQDSFHPYMSFGHF